MSSTDKLKVDFVFQAGMGDGFFSFGFLWFLHELRTAGRLPFRIQNMIASSTANLFIALFTGEHMECAAEICENFNRQQLLSFFHESPLRAIVRAAYQHVRHPSNLWPPLFKLFAKQRSIFSNNPLKATIRKYLPPETLARSVTSPINHIILTVNDSQIGNPKTRVKEWHTHDPEIRRSPEKLYNIFFAATGLQVMLPNEEIDGEYYSDCLFATRPIHITARTDPDEVFVVGLNITARPPVDVRYAGWLERSRKFTSAITGDDADRMDADFRATNTNVHTLEWQEAAYRAQWTDLPAEKRERFEAIAKESRERFHFSDRRYIPIHTITNRIAFPEPELYKFSNIELKHLFDEGYKSGLLAFRKLRLIDASWARDKLDRFCHGPR